MWNSLEEERGNKRTVLETTSPREISKRSGFANGYFLEKSFISIKEPRVSPFEWKSTQDDSKRLHYPSGKNDLVTWQRFLFGTKNRTTMAKWKLNYPDSRGMKLIIWIPGDTTINEEKRNPILT